MQIDPNETLSGRFDEDTARFAALLRECESFDLISRSLIHGERRLHVWTLEGLTWPP